ncbi:MAG TPA: helix-turn-helix transcriptional regulator [Thermoanaerobaculia bacterium]|nr:helix-turn-helix transcriptional regulator [Thermoanaerobaculia bacterium]
MGTKKRKNRERIDPAPRLGMVLIRYSLGLFEQQELAAALGVAPSQVSMWESGDRPIPKEILERTGRLRDLSRPLLAQLLREIRSFLQVSQGRSRAGRALAAAVAVDLLPLLVDVLAAVVAPLIQAASARSTAGDPAEAQELWSRLERRTPAQRLLIVEEGEEYQTLALHDRVLAESMACAATEPGEARELERLAARIAELAGPIPTG